MYYWGFLLSLPGELGILENRGIILSISYFKFRNLVFSETKVFLSLW